MILFLFILTVIASFYWAFQLLFAYLANIREWDSCAVVSKRPSISVIIPVFNENIEDFNKTIQSVLKQKNVDLQIIVIDDGSAIPLRVQTHPKVNHIRIEHEGKIEAQLAGIAIAKHEWVATIDSDTILDEYSLFHLYRSLVVQKVDAITGSVFLSNKNENLLTKTTACTYWYSFFQERASQSYFGCLMCCSGALSLYKKQTIIENIHHYLNQRVFGIKCFAGDDRQLSNIFLLDGKRIGWAPSAKAYTKSPHKLVPFLKQQTRWLRSHSASLFITAKRWREWSFMYSLLSFQLFFRYVYMFSIYTCSITMCIMSGSILPLLITFGTIMVITLIKVLIAYLYTSDPGFFYLLFYTITSFFLLNLVMFYAVATPTQTGWLTRYNKPRKKHE